MINILQIITLAMLPLNIFAQDNFEQIISQAIEDNPQGFFEQKLNGKRANLAISSGHDSLDYDLELNSSTGRNIISKIITTVDDIKDMDHIKKTDRKQYSQVTITFKAKDGDNYKVSCLATNEYTCGRLSLSSCSSKQGVSVGASNGGDGNFRYFYDEHLAGSSGCYKNHISNSRKNNKNVKEQTRDLTKEERTLKSLSK